MKQSSSIRLLSSALFVLSLACSGDEEPFPNPPATQGGTSGAGGSAGGAGGTGGAAGDAGSGGQSAGAGGEAGSGGDAGSGGSAGEAGGAAGQAGEGGNASGAGGDAAGAGGGSSGSAGTPSGVRVPDCEAPAESASNGSCVTLDDFVTCNPVSNAPCKEGETCDFAGAGTTSCFPPPNDAKLCQPCSNEVGPFCAGGHICLDNVCHRYCCADSDCGPGALCVVGVLKASQQEAGAGVCVRYEEEAGGAGGAAGAAGAAGAGGGGDFSISPACEGCFGQKCGAQFQACTQDGVCTACATQDPFQPSCETNQPWQNIVTCLCSTSDCGTTTCTNECAALAPQGAGGAGGGAGEAGAGGGAGEAGAAGESGSGGSSGGAGSGGASFDISPACEGCFGQKCGAQFQACTQDGVCTACATQDPFQPSCETNQPWQNIVTCLCSTSDCGTTTCTNECAALAPQGAGGAGGSGAAGQSGSGGASAGSGGAAGAGAGNGGAGGG